MTKEAILKPSLLTPKQTIIDYNTIKRIIVEISKQMNAQTKNDKTLTTTTTTPTNMPLNAEFKFLIDEGMIFLLILIIIYSFLTNYI